MKVALITPEVPDKPPCGGIGQHSQALADLLRENGHTAELFVGRDTAAIADGVRSFRPDVVESPDYLGLAVKLKHEYPLVVRLHTTHGAIMRMQGRFERPDINIHERRQLEQADVWLSPTHWMHGFTEGTYDLRKPTVVSPLVVSLDSSERADLFLPECYILYFGRIDRDKGVEDLVAAYRELPPRLRQEHDLVLIGHDRGNVALEHFGGLHILREIPHKQLYHVIRHAELVVLPSYHEAYGLAAVETMLLSTPLIYTTAASGPEVAGDYVRLVTPGDVIGLRDAMQASLENPDASEHLATQAMLDALERHTHPLALQQTLKAYKLAVQEHRRHV